ncbi:helix-hairpin-helix domain-containing protein [Halomicrobium salinisoli]|uniref:helix-hairpin-helix domain-containing protein n=1 Tax=Halomicrobium salinisoli TaxID=2878391 RepID=UPI001CF06F44|nr:helix-hairpin-helix domain-containing protein [Halomicrobium salinisoli]
MSVDVTVDDREPAGLVAALRGHPDVDAVAVRRLESGDVVSGSVAVERKTPGDYLRSALGRRGSDLEAQVRAMNEAYEHAYVLIEGDLADVEARWPDVPGAAVRGSLASITARLGAPVVPCGDRDRLVDVAVRLVRKHTESPSTRSLPPGAVPGRDEPTAKRMYGCIDGIGPETAARLYEAFPTVESLLAASREDLEAVDGVGPRRAAAIDDALRTEG